VAERPVFSQNIIAVIWDFDLTLSPHYMQQPLFDDYGIAGQDFWKECNALQEYYAKAGISVNAETSYLGHLLTYVQAGRMPDLSNARLRELGGLINFFPGVPDIFELLNGVLDKPEYQKWDLQLEHYVVSTGLKAMIQGSAVSPYLSGVWASEFIEQPAPPGYRREDSPQPGPISQIAGFLDNTTKTRAIFEINKGVNKHAEVSVNDMIEEKDRRVPVRNMIYVADGPSDIPSFSVIRRHGGTAFAVYDPTSERSLEQAESLRQSGRVDHFGVADYTPTSPTTQWLRLKVNKIAERIAQEKEESLRASRSKSPGHLD